MAAEQHPREAASAAGTAVPSRGTCARGWWAAQLGEQADRVRTLMLLSPEVSTGVLEMKQGDTLIFTELGRCEPGAG